MWDLIALANWDMLIKVFVCMMELTTKIRALPARIFYQIRKVTENHDNRSIRAEQNVHCDISDKVVCLF